MIIRKGRGFSLVELLLVLAILSLLAAILFPAFLSVRDSARQIVCVSNLRQLGTSIILYQQDYDGYFPYAVDPGDRAMPRAWMPYLPKFSEDIPKVGMIQDVLYPYAKSFNLFACPEDTGFDSIDYPSMLLSAHPSSFAKYGTSYYYRTTLAACHSNDAEIIKPAELSVLFDPVGFWHFGLMSTDGRYNILFADGHVKNLSRAQVDVLWPGRFPYEGC